MNNQYNTRERVVLEKRNELEAWIRADAGAEHSIAIQPLGLARPELLSLNGFFVVIFAREAAQSF
jgi:hypothetical protein